jgi:hypothetical protein
VAEKERAKLEREKLLSTIGDTPLGRYLVLRASRRFEVAGREMSESEIAEIFEEDPKTICQRINISGMNPTDAVLIPRSTIKRMSDDPLELFLSGWKHWCEKYELPLTETDLLRPASESQRSFGWTSSEHGIVTRSGPVTLALALTEKHDQPLLVFTFWLDATMREYGLADARTRPNEHGVALYIPPPEILISYDARVRSWLPPVLEETREEYMFRSGVPRLLAKGELPNRPVLDNFALIGFVAYLRKYYRSKYVLTYETEEHVQRTWKEMQEAIKSLNRGIFTLEGLS